MDTEAQRRQVLCPWSHSSQEAGLGLEPLSLLYPNLHSARPPKLGLSAWSLACPPLQGPGVLVGGGLQAARRWPRLPQVTCHELCHLLGLGNCRWLRCLMQGALRVDEALRRPLDLCPICLRKLQHLLGFRLVDRYKVSGRGLGGHEVSGRGG